MSHHFSDRYPPKNRQATELPLLQIQIEDQNGVRLFDPNSIVLACYHGEHKRWRPISDLNSEMSPTAEGRPIRAAVWYRTDDVELRLTPDEVYHLVMLRLDPDEFHILADRYGIFFEIHDDFYDEDTGEALQPKGNSDDRG